MFADGGRIDVHTAAEQMAAAVREFAGPTQEAGYRRLRDWLERLYRTEFDGFIAANFDSPLNLLNGRLAKLVALGGFRRWDTMVKRHISDPRLRRVFTFQSLYAGVAPQHALAVYAVIAYMDTISGVFFPAAACARCPTRWPRPPPTPECSSVTGRRSPRWNASAGGLPRSAPTATSGSPAMQWF